MTFKRNSRKGVGWSFEISVFQPYLKIDLTIHSLKTHANLFRDIEKLQLTVNSLARTFVTSFESLPESVSMPAYFSM